MNVLHVDKGGAYNVGVQYSQMMNGDVLIRPKIFQLLLRLYKIKNQVVVFHSPFWALKLGIFIRIFFPRVRVYSVEHFIFTEILKYEFKNKIKRARFFQVLKINEWIGIKTIVLDKFSKTNRRRVFGGADVTIIPNIYRDIEMDERNSIKEFDLIWAAGLSYQKKWPDVIVPLIEYKKKNSNLRIALTTYDTISDFDRENLENNGIEVYLNKEGWNLKSKAFFFTSNYEGFPLALLEAIKGGCFIVAWCQRSCVTQILKNYNKYSWIPAKNKANLNIINFSNIDAVLNEEFKISHSYMEVKKLIEEL